MKPEATTEEGARPADHRSPFGSGVRLSGDPETILREHHCRVTAPRLAVLRVLLDHDGPIDASQISELASAEVPGIHEATVYRTISVLTERGIASHVHAGHGPSLVRLSGDDALVAVCNGCGAIHPVPSDAVGELVASVRSATGFELEPGHFALEGRCPGCAA